MAPPSSICSNVNFSVRSALTLSSKVLPPPISLIDCLCRTHCQQTLQKKKQFAYSVSYYYYFLPTLGNSSGRHGYLFVLLTAVSPDWNIGWHRVVPQDIGVE